MGHPASLEEFQTFVGEFTSKRGFDDIAATLQLEPHAVTEDTVSMSMPLQESYAQASGLFSAAALFGAADITGTLLAMQTYAGSGQFPLAVQSSVNFLSNSQASPAIATARILRGGNTVAVAEVGVTDADGKALMHSTFTYAIKERRLGTT
ncbi:PaaI family thioesterase [Arthrobacter sp. AK01]|uniref:PaaI family thioesterase n=1 Tax=Micrococcaceae TaxID=1268 RepID=UPI001E5251E2|nr:MULTISPECIES: PaaI family thioesterase [Micrococcaceae]MCD4851282.1 PaaI family thioesterase [Arthrobacter sp. AK01]MCP1411435.1 uncharacterized protein (TIGR00369 family) [Paenarthrobacter sp. A20]